MKNKHIKWFLEQWKRLHWFIPLMFVFTIISNAATIAYPLVFRKLMDLLSNILSTPAEYPEPMKQVNRLLWLFLAIGAGQFIAKFYPLLRGAINCLFEHKLRMKYFQHIEGKDYTFFQRFRTGDIVTRLNDTNSSFVLCSGIFLTIDTLLIVIFGIAVMFYINMKLTLISLAPVPFILAVVYITTGKLVAGSQKNLEAISETNNHLEMSFSGIRIIKSFVSEDKYKRFFEQTLDNRIGTELKLVRLSAIQLLLLQYLNNFAQIAVVLFGGWLAVMDSITIGTFFLFYTYLSILVEPMFFLPNIFVAIKQGLVSINRLEELKEFPQHLSDHCKLEHIESLHDIRFENVAFSYPEKENPVIRNCNLYLTSGEKLLIMGATGSGKTTIINLLTGILHPTEGKVFINSIDMNDIDLLTWRNLIGCVPQEALLFRGTIKDNIQFSTENAAENAYQKAIQISQLANELKSFPLGEQTLVGTKGQSVSGGQKQRITIARAVVKQPQCLLLDDVTASLDAENEERLWGDLYKHYADITCIVVSQRLSTLRYVDKVLFIDERGECHIGTHNELQQQVQAYRRHLQIKR